ncbi:uracil-DNA glycosylase family protein [Agromyces subbeticus]|uniref:uracil-DNA glycosylase family protein n=1 Tax=Agromyces subbeticus TaxID=293890 RepID=UPI0003B5FCEF|nr:uracil-DNA glycosylase family protein [Agromyces subbeticus]
MTDDFAVLRAQVAADPENAAMTDIGWAPVFSGSSTARVAIVGQAPGRRAQESGTPFDDASGDRLVRWLGVSREEFHDPAKFAIVPMDFYFPGKGTSGDAPPRPSFAPRWHPLVFEMLTEVRLTILVGAYAQRHYLGNRRRASLTETVRAYRDYLPEIMPIVHPSGLNARWLAANPWFEAEVVPELRGLVMRAITTTVRDQPAS